MRVKECVGECGLDGRGEVCLRPAAVIQFAARFTLSRHRLRSGFLMAMGKPGVPPVAPVSHPDVQN